MNLADSSLSPDEAPFNPSPASQSRALGILALLDRLLREREQFFELLFSGREIWNYCRLFGLITVVLCALYGLTMGATAWTGSWQRGLAQMTATTIKLPLLYMLSLAVCFPVLYIVLVLMGSKLRFGQGLALILMALAFNSVLLASCAPIALFFAFTGASYDFIKLLHVVICAFSGLWAMMALLHGLRLMCEKSDLYPKKALRILQIWALIFGFVGTQMAWSLRPFIGEPNMQFTIFRQQEGNFYQAVGHSVLQLFRTNDNK
jgi:hypothetical protein